MSDYRNLDDPWRRDTPYDLNAGRGGGAAAWVAGAVLVVILVALAFGVGRTPNQAGANNRVANNMPMTQPTPAPSGPASRAFSPTPVNPAPMNPMAPPKP